MTDRPIDVVLEKLAGVRRSGDTTTAKCPAHDDKVASLSITTGDDDRVLLFCHAGCENEKIVAALGLEMRDLFPSKESRGTSVVADYRYVDEHGRFVHGVEKRTGKKFLQYTLGDDGQRVYSLNGTRPILYQRKELLEGVRAGRWILIVEGEKDVDTLRAHGFVATCNSGGAGKWREEYGEDFVGAKVAILPDNDKPGRKHASSVACSVGGVASTVRVVELPDLAEKGDVWDWFAAGGTEAELKSLIENAPEWVDTQTDYEADPGVADSDKSEGADDERGSERRSMATQLVDLALERYRFASTPAGDPFAVEHGSHVVRMLRGGRLALRAELARRYRTETGRAPSASALADALVVLEGHAADIVEPVHLRVARTGDGLVLDLGDEAGHVVVITGDDWQVVDDSPVLFTRSALTLPLPMPVKGGRLDEARDVLNVDDGSWPLVVGELVAALFPDVAHTIPALYGEQGSGKTTFARIMTSLVDPSAAPVRSVPRDVEQWAIGASASYMFVVDYLEPESFLGLSVGRDA